MAGRDMSGPWRDRFVTALDGLKLHVRDYGPRHGAATPVVCLPGLTRNVRDFHELALFFARHRAQARRVLAISSRGRGQSEHDPDPAHYDPVIEARDALDVMTACNCDEAILIGTSRGGILAMIMAVMRPAALKAVVLNDIGPVIEADGLRRIRSYVGQSATPRDWTDAIARLKAVSGGQFPDLADEDWRQLALKTWRDNKGQPADDYDPALSRTLAALDPDNSELPQLWPQFAALSHVPLLVIRGGNSDLLSAATVEEMLRRHPDARSVTVPAQGHAPLLVEEDILNTIASFTALSDAVSSSRQPDG